MAKKQWVYSPKKPAKPKVPADVKTQVKTQADTLVETTLKPTHIKPPPEEPGFNYISDIYTKWYRNYFYFCATYQSPGPNAVSPEFETKFACLEYLENGNFNLSYMRHTGQWLEMYQDLILGTCLNSIENEPHFMP